NTINRLVFSDCVKNMQGSHVQALQEIHPRLPLRLHKLQQAFLVISLLSLPKLDEEMNNLGTESKLLWKRLILVLWLLDGCHFVVPSVKRSTGRGSLEYVCTVPKSGKKGKWFPMETILRLAHRSATLSIWFPMETILTV